MHTGLRPDPFTNAYKRVQTRTTGSYCCQQRGPFVRAYVHNIYGILMNMMFRCIGYRRFIALLLTPRRKTRVVRWSTHPTRGSLQVSAHDDMTVTCSDGYKFKHFGSIGEYSPFGIPLYSRNRCCRSREAPHSAALRPLIVLSIVQATMGLVVPSDMRALAPRRRGSGSSR